MPDMWERARVRHESTPVPEELEFAVASALRAGQRRLRGRRALRRSVSGVLAGCACFEHLPLGWLRRGLRLVGEHSLEIYLLNVSLFSETALLRSWLPLGTGPYYFLAFFLNILLGILLHRGVEAGMRRIQARRAD